MYVSTQLHTASSGQLTFRLQSFACQFLCTAVIVFNYLVLAGWVLNINILQRLAGSMLPATSSLCFASLAMSLFLFEKGQGKFEIDTVATALLLAPLSLVAVSIWQFGSGSQHNLISAEVACCISVLTTILLATKSGFEGREFERKWLSGVLFVTSAALILPSGYWYWQENTALTAFSAIISCCLLFAIAALKTARWDAA